MPFSSYATVQDVRDLGLTPDDAVDSVIETTLLAVERIIDEVTEDRFLREDALTFSLAGHNTPTLFLPKRVRTITSVSLYGQPIDASWYTLHKSLNAAGDWFDADRDYDALERLGTVWPERGFQGAKPIAIVGDFSWAAVPAAIRSAAALLAYRRLKPSATFKAGSGVGTVGSLVRLTTETATFEYDRGVETITGAARGRSTGYPDIDQQLDAGGFIRTPVYIGSR